MNLNFLDIPDSSELTVKVNPMTVAINNSSDDDYLYSIPQANLETILEFYSVSPNLLSTICIVIGSVYIKNQ